MSGVEAVVGVAAAGVGFASLAIQLLDSIQKLKAFHGKVQNAPTSLDDVIFDLETIGRQLDLLERHKSHDTSEAELLARCIDRCHMRTDKIEGIVGKIQSIGNKNASLGKFYTAFKDPDIARLVAELEQAKTSLHSSMLTFYFDRQSRLLQEQAITTQQQNIQLALISTHVQANTTALASLRDPPDAHHPAAIVPDDRSQHPCRQSQHSPVVALASKQVKRCTKRSARKRAWKFTVQFPRQICSQIWSLSLARAESGWDLKLRTYMARDPHSEIFFRCLTGDVKAVQRMIAEGEASLWDHSPLDVVLAPTHSLVDYQGTEEHHLLWIAAFSGQPDLVRWLLQACGDSPGISFSGLLHVFRLQRLPSSKLGRVLRDLLKSDSIDMDLDLTVPDTCGFLRGIQESQINIMLDSGILSDCQQSALNAFEAIHSRSDFITAKTFLKLIGLKSTSLELATLITSNERFSTLHVVAKMLAQVPDDLASTDSVVEDWLEIASTVLKHGFEPSTVADIEITALWCLVDQCPETPSGGRWASKLIRAWVRTVQEAGIDLLEYGRCETEIWRLRYLRQTEDPDFRLTEMCLSYCRRPGQWGVTKFLSTVKSVPLYKMERMPGTFEPSPDIPTYICWVPHSLFEDTNSWQFVTHAKTWWHSRDAFQEEENDKYERDNVFTKAYLTADDAALTIRLATRSTKWTVGPRRCASVAPKIDTRYDEDGRPALPHTPSWYGYIHYCAFTVSYESGKSYNRGRRSCVNGACRQRPNHQAAFAWSQGSFLADIRDCQDGFIRPNCASDDFRPWLLSHTGTRECPHGCAKVHLDRLHVPAGGRKAHPKRVTSDRWNEP